MKASVFTATLCVGALATGAFAAEVAIRGSINQTFDASDNYFLSTSPSGITAKSNTSGSLDVLTLTPTTSYLLNSNYSYYKYFGPGAADTQLQWGTPASALFKVDHVTELDRYKLAASWSRNDAVVTQLAQTGVASARGSINTYDVTGGVTHELGRNDTISLSSDVSTVSFTDPNQTPYKDVSSTLLWVHSIAPTTTMTNSINFDWFAQDNAANSQRLMWRATSGLQSQITALLSVHGDLGWVWANAYQNANAAAAASATTPLAGGVTPFQPQIGAGNGWFGNVGMSYRLLKNTTVSMTAAQSIVPVFTGQLQQSQTLGLNVSHQINQASNLSFFASWAETSSPGQIGQVGTVSDFFSTGVNYGYSLTREWRTNVSYTFRDSVNVAKSSTILFSLSRDFTLLGNPTILNKADEVRARQRARQSIGQVFPTFQ